VTDKLMPSEEMVEVGAKELCYIMGGNWKTRGDRALFRHRADVVLTAALQASRPAVDEARPIDTAPKDCPILAWWPIVALDDDLNLTDRETGGQWVVTEWNGGCWLEPDVLNCLNANAFDDEEEYAEAPRAWLPLPAALTTSREQGNG